MTTRKSASSDRGQVILYKANDGAARVEVRLHEESVWLTQAQMAVLFSTERSVITKHINNVLASKELPEESNVQKMHIAGSDKPVKFFNLDMIISVGYRVNSKRGTQFRIWATRVVREHILKGFTVNEKRLKELQRTIRLVQHVIDQKTVTGEEATALLRVITDYSYALDILDDYDHQRIRVTAPRPSKERSLPITYDEARRAIEQLREKFKGSDLFGKEKDKSLESSLATVFQSFDRKELYPSVEDKAANLLYFLVKNHSFVDGNKRIAAALFLRFLDKNAALYRPDGTKRIADNALVAITLLIAESRPAERETITSIVVNLINRREG